MGKSITPYCPLLVIVANIESLILVFSIEVVNTTTGR